MDEILYTICRHNVSIMDGWHPFPATLIARQLNVSVGKVRYHLRKLKEKGLVSSFHDGGITDYGDVYCCFGWKITQLTKETEEYKKAHEEERKLCNECFDIDIGE